MYNTYNNVKQSVWRNIRNTQKPYVWDICDFFSVSYNYPIGSTSFLKVDLVNLDNYLFQELKIIFTTIIAFFSISVFLVLLFLSNAVFE